jgi:hypothetical protein
MISREGWREFKRDYWAWIAVALAIWGFVELEVLLSAMRDAAGWLQ